MHAIKICHNIQNTSYTYILYTQITTDVIHCYPTYQTHLPKSYMHTCMFLVIHNYVLTNLKLRCDDLYTTITQQYLLQMHTFYF